MYSNSTHPQALPATTTYMQVATAAPAAKVNLRELAEVDAIHLPSGVIRFSPLEELHREGQHVKAKHPNLSEEVDFRLAVEAKRRSLAHLQLA